jgi:hypothetical protein
VGLVDQQSTAIRFVHGRTGSRRRRIAHSPLPTPAPSTGRSKT